MLAWKRTSDPPWEERSLGDVVEQCLRESWSRLYGYAVSLCGDREAARDLIQSSAVKALDTNAPPREPAAARAWLFRVMRNDWIDRGRRATVRAADREPVEPTEGPWAYEDARIAAITVRQGLDRLEPYQREIIELVDLAGFRYAEAAEILEVPVGTVMSRLSRARLALLEAIEGGKVMPLERSRGTR
ncbi:RNA polymerase sigma factor [Chenggangzhangella methanolivorans]|uniref:RNA polymerase sigma factor n=1 Tax=Chenggangzhangella methanolivorans TaxID=1437009 RepID=A0A9E6RCH8_9HYPH|nr:RNA polymerase sigma factor [Chenggangzhangella methanolivorans]QZO01737.1 RNA polymerase sigma factor [Chenggangzhangella methanolivorans]